MRRVVYELGRTDGQQLGNPNNSIARKTDQTERRTNTRRLLYGRGQCVHESKDASLLLISKGENSN